MSEERIEFERELVERLIEIAPRPRRDALDRATLAIARTPQRRGWQVQMAGALAGGQWTSLGATAAIATVALVIGVAIGRFGLPAGHGPFTAPSPSPPPCVESTPGAAGNLSPEAVAWNSDRWRQDWPGPLRMEPSGCAPLLVPADGLTDIQGHSDVQWYSYDDPPDDGGQEFALVDIVEVKFGEGCWAPLSGCVFFDMAADVPRPIPNPRDEWVGYGIVVDSTGDGRPDLRFGIDNAPDDLRPLRMWRTDLATDVTFAPFGILESPQVMDAFFPGDHSRPPSSGDFNPGSIFAYLAPEEPVFRFYVWASVIVDGQIVATDYAPDVGWIEMPPQADE